MHSTPAAMAGSSDNDQTFPKEHKNVEWLIDIMKKIGLESSSMPRIGRVPAILKDNETNKACFDPKVVSLGPYHHGKDYLKKMEDYKEVAAQWFISPLAANADVNWDEKVREIYRNFVSKVAPNTKKNPIAEEFTPNLTLRDWYAAEQNTIDKLSDEHLTIMMFVDGCFILYFIYLSLKKYDDLMKITHLNPPFILRDMFLLENQVPYAVLNALMSLTEPSDGSNNQRNGKGKRGQSHAIQKKDIEDFIEAQFLPKCKAHDSSPSCLHNLFEVISPCLNGRNQKTDESNSSNDEPLHLLDFLRIKLIGGQVNLSDEPCNDYYFRSIMELKTAGIKPCRSDSGHLKEIKYKKGIFRGHLSLPQMVVDDLTKTWLLNLMAYETCPERPSNSDSVITSYVCFLDSLIDHTDDVKELRSKGILLNRLGSDEEVANLFNELANNLMPNPKVYGDIMREIEKHCRSPWKVWFAEILHTHFSSPWTVISLIAAIFLLFLTVIQTVFTVWD